MTWLREAGFAVVEAQTAEPWDPTHDEPWRWATQTVLDTARAILMRDYLDASDEALLVHPWVSAITDQAGPPLPHDDPRPSSNKPHRRGVRLPFLNERIGPEEEFVEAAMLERPSYAVAYLVVRSADGKFRVTHRGTGRFAYFFNTLIAHDVWEVEREVDLLKHRFNLTGSRVSADVRYFGESDTNAAVAALRDLQAPIDAGTQTDSSIYADPPSDARDTGGRHGGFSEPSRQGPSPSPASMSEETGDRRRQRRKALALRAQANAHLETWSDALADIDAALALEPEEDIVEMLGNRGWFLCRLHRYEEGRTELERALAMPQEDLDMTARLLLNHGLAMSRLGNKNAALADYAQAGIFAPDDPLIYFDRAGVLSEVGRLSESIENLSEAIRIDHRLRANARRDPDLENVRRDGAFGPLFRELCGTDH